MFTAQNLQLNRGTNTSNVQGTYTATAHTYIDMSSTVAEIKSYFPPYLGQGPLQEFLHINDLIFIFGSDNTNCCKILSLAPFTVGTDLFSGASGLSILPPSIAVDQNGAVISGDTFSLEIADLTHPGIVTTDTQRFGGEKTFTGNLTVIAGDDIVFSPVPLDGIIVRGNEPVVGHAVLGGDDTQAMVYAFGTQSLGQLGGTILSPTGFSGSGLPEIGLLFNPTNFPSTAFLTVNTTGEVSITPRLKTDVILPATDTPGTAMFINNNEPTNITFMNGLSFNEVGGITWPPSSNGASMETFQTNVQQAVSFEGAYNTPRNTFFTVSVINEMVTLYVGGLSATTIDNAQPIYTTSGVLPIYARPASLQNIPIQILSTLDGAVGNAIINTDGTIYIYVGNFGGNFTVAGLGGFRPFSLNYSTLY